MKSKKNFVSKNKRKSEEVPGFVYGNISHAATNLAVYIIGSLVVAVAMTVAMPLIIESGSDLIVKKLQKPLKSMDDKDWEPERARL